MLNIALLIKKYSVPFIFGLIGFILLLSGMMNNQSMEFIFASIVILGSAIVSALNVSGKISSKVTKIIGFVSLAMAIVVLGFTFTTVQDTVKHNNDYKACKGLSIRNLRDVQTAQKAYLVKNQVYAADWKSLEKFIKEDSIAILDAEGSVPSRKITEKERDYLIQFDLYKKGQAIDNKMTELEAYYLSRSPECPVELVGFRRDTVNVSFIETTFSKNRSYMKERMDNGYGDFIATDLKYIPFTDKKAMWKIDTAFVVIGSDTLPTVRIAGDLPLTEIKGAPKKENMFFGKLDNSDLSGSWEVQ
ncbi:hypothetical protein N9O41_01800 [Crocinitomicaceae bacterium]|jgi:hypothetical protein|nr:hypothetical protein [Crocinitomicaceae bacterium]